MHNKDFVHLHLHNEFSFLDGCGTAKQYTARAKELGFTGIALTNHGNMDGCIRWQQACMENGLASLLGFEAYVVKDLMWRPPSKAEKDKRYHITLLAKNETGWRNLLRMLSMASMQGFYYRPRIDPDLLLQYSEGVVALTGCVDSILKMDSDVTKRIIEAFGEDLYLEMMPHDTKEQAEIIQLALETRKHYPYLKLVATNDCHYVNYEDKEIHEVLLAIQNKAKWDDPKRWKFDPAYDLHMKTADEMLVGFSKQRLLSTRDATQACMNTKEVEQKCAFIVKKVDTKMPSVFIEKYKDLSDDDKLIALAVDGLESKAEKHEYIKEKLPAYYDRLEDELKQIIELGFSRYFLIVWELMDWCRNNDVMYGPGRGSVGGSLVAYCLWITMVDPLKFGLVFARFISPARIDLPDIDMDFEDRKRDRIRKHFEDLYGEHNVSSLSTFAELHGRGALRDVGRVFDVPMDDIDKAAKSIVVRSTGDLREDFSIEDSFKTFEDGKRFYAKYPKVAEIAMRVEGQIKSAGKHAAAICILADDIRTGNNACYSSRKGDLIVNWDKWDAEYMGLMKMDVLGLNELTKLSECRKLILKRHGVDIDYEKIPLDDVKVFEEFTKGNNIGCFQLNSLGMMRICQEIGIDSFKEVAAINALHRPGCLRSGMVTEYKLRKKGEKPIPKVHPYIDNITSQSYGIVLYQEQVMLLMYELAGLPWKTADGIRKVISKKQGEEQFMTYKKIFMDGCKAKKTLDEDAASRVFDEVRFFGNYGFNLSHAVEYAMMAYWDMWLKIYYPSEFIETLLSYDSSEERKETFVSEARRLGLGISLPSLNQSDAEVWTNNQKGNLVIPFGEIKGIGQSAAVVIVNARNKGGPFKNKEDFLQRIEKRKVNKRVVETLDAVGAMVFGDDGIDTKSLADADVDRISEHFNFSVSSDPMHRYRKCLNLIGPKLPIDPIGKIVWKVDKTIRFYFGNIDLLRFGFRDKFVSAKAEAYDVRGTAGDMGGVYCNMRDDTGFSMVTFSRDLYHSRKDEIEHCEGRWGMVSANHPWNASNLRADRIWFDDDILSGKLGGSGLALATELDTGSVDAITAMQILKCKACALRAECKAPVRPSAGRYNISIIGEGPGREEDGIGKGFVGDSGRILWSALDRYGFKREDFHVTNVVKCWPSKTRTPAKEHIDACGGFLQQELSIVRPFLILAFGNTCNQFFTGEAKGIMDLSGTVVWSDKYQAWICWSVHPASVLYDRGGVAGNRARLDSAIETFADRVGSLGFGL